MTKSACPTAWSWFCTQSPTATITTVTFRMSRSPTQFSDCEPQGMKCPTVHGVSRREFVVPSREAKEKTNRSEAHDFGEHVYPPLTRSTRDLSIFRCAAAETKMFELF